LRAKDRAKMRELFVKAHGSEKGLGDVILEAYDRGVRRAADREARLRSIDPNARVTDPLDFTLSALEGESLRLASLRGKVIIMDFWATWCGPCRTQKPLYDEVKRRFAGRNDVVFLAVNADEDRSRVAPFVEAEQWGRNFEDGLAAALRISSIPTTVVFGKDGQVFARFNGFVPDRFVEMLSERIEAALQQPSQ
jgi:thiol-disulfide isomerase/thioredoxin